MNEENFASESDQSDEDFCPDDDQSAGGSEEESEDISEEENNGENEIPSRLKKNKKLISKRSKNTNKAQQKLNNLSDGFENTTNAQRRPTRQTNEHLVHGSKTLDEKDEIESDEEDKSRIDALWSDFLSDVKQPTIIKKLTTNSPSKTCSSKQQSKTSDTVSGNKSSEVNLKEDSKMKSTENQNIIVTEIVDFAGEAVTIQKTISANNIKRNKETEAITTTSPLISTQKRTAGSGLGSILNQISKKKKISVLEKTKLDWNTFKQDEGIDEQLQTHNKGKDGYLERQDFLQRTDLRQFEIEKNLRQTKRTQ